MSSEKSSGHEGGRRMSSVGQERRRSSVLKKKVDAGSMRRRPSAVSQEREGSVPINSAKEEMMMQVAEKLENEKKAEAAQRFEVERKEKEKFRSKLEESECETRDLAAYYQKELEDREERLRRLDEKLVLQETEWSIERKNLVQSHEDQVKALEARIERTENVLTGKIRNLEDELGKFEMYRDTKIQTEARICHLEAEVRRAQGDIIQSKEDHERNLLLEKNKMIKELDRRSIEIRQEAKLEMQDGMDTDMLRIVAENRRMAEELKFQQQTTTELQDDKQKIQDQVKILKRDLELAAHKEKEFALQLNQKKRDLATAQKKLKSAQSQSQPLPPSHDNNNNNNNNKASLPEISSQQGHKLSTDTEIHTLRQVLHFKSKELAQIRRLAETVLEQRTEVEHFFLDALAQVKEQIRIKRFDQYRQDLVELRQKSVSSAPLPKIRAIQSGNTKVLDDLACLNTKKEYASAGPHSALPKCINTKVFLKDLSLEDREHVLRLLFAKINAVHGSVISMPPHPLEGEDGSDRTFVTNSTISCVKTQLPA